MPSSEGDLLRSFLRHVQDVAAETGDRNLTAGTLAGVQRFLAERGLDSGPSAVEALFEGIIPVGAVTWRPQGPVFDEPGFPEPPKPPAPGPWEPGEPGPPPEPPPEPPSPERLSWKEAVSVVVGDFLTAEEVGSLLEFTLSRAGEFQPTTVVNREQVGGVVDRSHRNSTAIYDLGEFRELLERRLAEEVPKHLERLGMESFQPGRIDAQITATGDGGFFRAHSDNGSDHLASRGLTFVYFFHPEPRRFEGGELRIYDTYLGGGTRRPGGRSVQVEPRQNTLVLFPPELVHEVVTVRSGSDDLGSSRLTLNGWLHA